MIYTPYPYQRYCINRGIQQPAIAFWLDMGLGKTSITSTVIRELKYDMLQARKCLIIAPKKVAEATWQRERDKWAHLSCLRFVTVLGSQAQRIRALNSPGDVWVINRDNTAWLVDYYKNEWPFDMVVLDESSSFKNPRAIRFKKLRAVRPHIKRLVELTGTPAPRGYIDLWAQIYLLDGGQRLGKTVTAYREAFFIPDKRSRVQVFSYKLRDGAKEEIDRRLSDIVISMRAEDYLQLPPVMVDDIPVALDPAGAKAYKQLERDMLLRVNEEEITAASAAVLNGKLLQLCNGAIYDETHNYHEIHKCKIEAFVELMESLQGKPALVFYSFQHDKERIESALKPMGLKVRGLKTAQDETDWNAGKIDVLLAHPASCAYGLNLQDGGNHAIWFGLNYDLELYLQANKRLHRQGQTEPVIIHRLLVQGGRDEDVAEVLEGKDDIQERLLQSLKARIESVKGGKL